MAGETLLNNRYELVAQQGSGGMSVIYKAIDRALTRTVAIKILRPSLTQDKAFLEKFQQEARSVAKMSHPNIVTVHDVGNDGPTHYIVMEMIDGQDLKKLIKTRGALPVDMALDFAIQICDGLGYAHRNHLVHADVKPQNILLAKENIIKITDFGIAQAYTDTMPQTRAEVVWGSPHYFAPEQARGEKPSPASDVYSIGIVMYEMFTGRLPFVGTSQRELAMAHIQGDVPRAKSVNPAVPDEISNVIFKVMSKRPNDRFKQADQLGHVLKGIRDRNSSPSPLPDRAAPQTVVNQRKVDVTQPKSRPPSVPQPLSNAAPTVQYGAPVAPTYNSPQSNRQSGNVPPRPVQASNIAQPQPFVDNQAQGLNRQPQSPNPIYDPGTGRFNPGRTGGYTPPPFAQKRQQEGLDVVTIILVMFALISVLGLLFLYIFGVFPALSG